MAERTLMSTWIRMGLALACGTGLLVSAVRAQEPKPEAAQKPQSEQAVSETAKPDEKPKTDVKLPPAAEILARHVEKTGGEKAYMQYSSRHGKGTIELGAGMTGELETFTAKPDKMLVRMNLPKMGLFTTGFNGKVAWSINPMAGPMLMEGSDFEQLRVQSDFYLDVRKAKHFKTIETVDLTDFEGKKCYDVKLVPESGPTLHEFYDVETGLRHGTRIKTPTPMGEMELTAIETDYKKVGDLLLPMTAIQKTPMEETTLKTTSVEFDKVEEAVFELPAEIKALLAAKKDEKKSDVP